MKRTIWKLLAVLTAFTLIAAACGDDDDSADSSSADTSDSGDTADADADADAGGDDTVAEECPATRGVTDTSILFGSSMPLTGNLAALGADATFAIEMTADRINAGGGVNGRMVEISVPDDGYHAEATLA